MELIAAELERIYDSDGTKLYRSALAVTGCGSLAEDAVHNAFSKAFRLGKRPGNVRAYLFRSVRNAAIDLMRSRNRTVPITAEMIFECAPDQLDQVVRRERLDRVSAALTELTSDERETVVQYLVAQLTFQEIADLRGRPMGTVTSWYRRGLRKLKGLVNDDEEFI